ncbi:MAG: hypothetical protein UY16_C0002G0043 [Candidatus Gottesmanbacteria bacterium GW2011_GWA2_47_9]|uniref:Uncharacterized protein n=2 Tax=Candidatus Gottesmaniibacteriota TaxID=1752720 RepID=A0A0G1UQB3_9BACT|nr:MAG: hypothetical protein UY16_C0002G0043 [Candidatus Gottesmanbacteria bacterium GW2011_GWA2_47_9]KKU96256.1 MAG: hypothetical protein UY27_C0002G0041 [Candidatus Gottesmanbacteria bacterium GW2011_GWA1_48_13]
MADILDAAQKQINDATQQAPGTAAVPPVTDTPPSPAEALAKEAPTEAESKLVDSIIQATENKPIPNTPPAAPEQAPNPEPAPIPPPPPSATEPATAAPAAGRGPSFPNLKKKGPHRGFLIAVFFLLFATLPLGVYFVSQQKQVTDLRSRAAVCWAGTGCSEGYHPETWPSGPVCCENAEPPPPPPPVVTEPPAPPVEPPPPPPPGGCANGGSPCGGGRCPDGWEYGGDPCALHANCDIRHAEACVGHGGGGTTPTPTPGGGTSGPPRCTVGVTNGPCSQQNVPGSSACTDSTGVVNYCCPSGYYIANRCGGNACCINDQGVVPTPTTATGGGGGGGGGGITREAGTCTNGVCTVDSGNSLVICECPNGLDANGDCAQNCRIVSSGSANCQELANQTCTSVQLDIKPAGITDPHQANDQITGTIVCNPTSTANCSTPPPPGGGGGGGENPTPTPTPGPLTLQCTRIRVYKGTQQLDTAGLAALKQGDVVTLAVAGANASQGRIRVNGGDWNTTSTKNTSDEFTVDFTIPGNITSFTIEAEVYGNGVWK